jgi:uncharacterized membrane protein YphA (DoxX/SURF4 family)
MGEIYIVFMFFLLIFGTLFWSYHYPEDSLLWGKRWMYKEEPELTDEAIRYTKKKSLIGMVVLVVIFGMIVYSELF